MTLAASTPATQGCPFCGLLCDDLPRELLTPSRVKELTCARAREGFAAALAPRDTQPRIMGKPVSLEAAVSEAAALLRRSKQPLIAGLATDVAGMQALMPLAQRTGAITDHMNSAVRRINSAAVQDTSGVYTTFAEARHRADVVVLCGGDLLQGFPRVFERVLPAGGEFLNDQSRGFISLGDAVTHRSYEAAFAHMRITHALPSTPDTFIDLITALHCEVRGVPHAMPGNTALSQVAAQLKAARYAVFVWNAASFVQPQPDLSARALLQLINTLNQTTRAAALMLGGSHGDATTEAVHLWQSGAPWGSRFINGVAHHEPMRSAARALMSAREVDALLWIDALGSTQYPSGLSYIPSIVIGQSPSNIIATVSIPAGVLGIDDDAQLFRADRVVVVPIRALRRLPPGSTLPSVAQVVRQLHAALREGAA